MFTIEELEAFSTLTLHSLLLEAVNAIVVKWRTIPLNQMPSEEDEQEIKQMELYSMTIAKILIARGALPENWGK